jgi:NhaP-type Na+/H+ or K+/H+ antiporter
LAGVACQWVAWRLRLPAIVLLFAVGLLVGPGLQVLRPGYAFGNALRPMIELTVAVIVFEGGLALNVRELRAAGEGVLRLTTLALPIAWVLATIAAHGLTRMGWAAAILFGAITVVTGPTVVLPLLRQTRLVRRPASFLKWEAILNDPVGAILSALVLQVLLVRSPSESSAAGSLVLHVLAGLVVSVCLGAGAALLVRWSFTRDQVPEPLKTPLLLALALSVYAVSNLALSQAGLTAATLFGVVLANLRTSGISELKRFKEGLVVLLVSALFIVLTADLDRAVLAEISWRLVVLTLTMLLVRPAAVMLATLRTGLPLRERVLTAWVAPRGIVAASVAGLAGERLHVVGYPGAELVMPAVFVLIAATMVLHGFSLRPLARRLGLTLGDAPGLAIIGASVWSTDMASALHEIGVPVVLIDTFPGALDQARVQNLPVLQAEILSEHGEEELEGRRVDYVFAASPDEIYNNLVCARLAPELGRERVFQLAPPSGRVDQRRGTSREWRGKILGDPPLSYDMFEVRAQEGWRFRTVEIGNGEGAVLGESREDHVALLGVRGNGALIFASLENAAQMLSEAAAGDRFLVFARHAARQRQTPEYEFREKVEGASAHTGP